MKLELKNISKSYGKTMALKGFSKEFVPGIYALLGPNGSGKTTLMNIIATNLRPNNGEILFNGENVTKLGVNYREIIGYMPQSPGLYPYFTAMDFLLYISALKGLNGNYAKEKIIEMLGAVEMEDYADVKIKNMSGGMKQRVALASAVIGEPKILILDEPTAGLDPKQRIIVKNLVASFAVESIVIIATHVVPDVELIAKDVLMLKNGEIVLSGSPDSLIESMHGKVWSKAIEENELAKYKEKFSMTNISKHEDKLVVRIVADSIEEAQMVQPNLEDCYFNVFGVD
ncbi:MAG: ATP-binding cassette domain-containing protein [Clostridiales bacterium]|nr:ATP-binding cassette domain-containing protein [Clostridiales bacterium]